MKQNKRKKATDKSAQKQPSVWSEVYPAVNRNYKDRVFRMLFREPKELLSLYNALNGTQYTDETELTIVTLESALYMGMKNDVAFVFDSQLMLYEHQSTFSKNLPLRDLFYISSEYQKLIDIREISVHTTKKIMLPTPRFVVFYNGSGDMPDRMELKLSDLYERQEEDPSLELKVLILNINEGHNTKIVSQCKTLLEYCQFVARIRKYVKIEPIEIAVKKAVEECVQENILWKFLQQNKAEVIAVSIFEFNEEEEWRRIRRDQYEMGKEDGKKEGKLEGKLQSLVPPVRKMLSKGLSIFQIAGWLEQPEDEIARIAEMLQNHPEADDQAVVELLLKQ